MKVRTLLRFSAVLFFLEGASLLMVAFDPWFIWFIFVFSVLGIAWGILILYGFSMVKGGNPTGWVLVLIIGVLGFVTIQGLFLGPILAIYSAFKLRQWTRGMNEKDKLKLLDTVGEAVRIDKLTREALGNLAPLIGASRGSPLGYAVSWEILDVKDFFFEDVDEDDDVIDLVDSTERLAHFPEYHMFEGLIEERRGELEEEKKKPYSRKIPEKIEILARSVPYGDQFIPVWTLYVNPELGRYRIAQLMRKAIPTDLVELLGGEKMPDNVRAKVFLDCLTDKFQSFGRDSGGPSVTINGGPIMTFGWGMPIGAMDQLIDFDQLIAADIWGLGLAVAGSLYWHQLRYYCSHDKGFVREVYGKEDASGSSFISMRESSASYIRITEPSRTQVREMESAGVGDDILAYHGMFYMYSLAFLFKQVEKFSKEVGTLQQITRPNFSKIKEGMGWNVIQSDQKKAIMLAQGLRVMNEAISTFDTPAGTGGLNELLWIYFRCFKLLMNNVKGDTKLRKIGSYAASTLREYLSIAIKDLSIFDERIQEITSLLSQIKEDLPAKDRIRINQVVSHLKDVLS